MREKTVSYFLIDRYQPLQYHFVPVLTSLTTFFKLNLIFLSSFNRKIERKVVCIYPFGPPAPVSPLLNLLSKCEAFVKMDEALLHY